MDRILIEDIARIRCAGKVRMSPDGAYAAFVVEEPDHEKNDYTDNIWLADPKTGSCGPLTFSGKDGNFIWDDGRTLLIPTVRTPEDKPEEPEEKTVFYRLPVCGGEARKAFSVPANVTGIEKIEDGLYCMAVLTDRYRPDPKTAKKEICLEEQDYHVFEELPIWGNGRGFVAGKRTALFLYDEAAGSLTRLTGADTDVSGFYVSGREILWIAKTWNGVIPVCSEAAVYDLDTGNTECVVEAGKMKISHAAFCGGGIVLTATDMEPWGTGQLCDFYRYDRKTRTLAKVCGHQDLHIGNDLLLDTQAIGGSEWRAVGEDVYFTGQSRFSSDLYRLTADGRIEKALDFAGGCISCFDTDGKTVYFVGSAPDSCGDLYRAALGEHENAPEAPCRLTDLNDELLAGKYTAKAEYLSFTDSDGYSIDGWVLRPIDYDPQKKYPAVLEIHGGPRCAYGAVFFHEMQVLASMGYFVFYCNPRGSEGYGEEFADLRGKYGTIDYKDLMEFTDHVLARIPQIDPARIGAAGGSYGGFMCNWIEGHTDRFAAIASQRSVSNWVADFGASEIGVTFDRNEMGATPWNGMEKMWEQSPLKYACNAKTPILFIHSLCDYNCTIDQGVEMFAAMKYFGVPSRMCVFEGENHELSRSGKPKHRIRRLREITDWFERYVKEGGRADG